MLRGGGAPVKGFLVMHGMSRNGTYTGGYYRAILRPTSRATRALFGLLLAVFAIKAVVLAQLRDHPLLAPDAGLDTSAYVRLAQQVLAGDVGLGPGLYYVSPFYVYFLAAVLGVCHSFTAVRVVQIALGTASIGLIFLTARRWYGERAAWVAAVLATLTGLFTFYEVLILQSSVDVVFTAAALWCVPDLPAAAGIIWGVQTLNRPNVLIAALGVALALGVARRRVRPAALLVAGLLIGLAPVAIRNVVVAHQWTLVSSHGGLNFYIGNNADATGFYRPVPGVRPAIVGQEVDTRRIASEALGRPATDAEASSYFFGLGLAWIREHPLDAARLFAKKFAFTFHAVHLALPQSYAFFAYDTPGILRYLFVGPWLLAPLGIVGSWLLLTGSTGSSGSSGSAGSGFGVPGSGFDAAIWLSFVPCYAAAVALFFVADRYRLPLLVPLCVCAAGAVDFAIDAVRQSHVRRLAGPAAALVALFVAVNWPTPGIDDNRWTDGLRTAERLVLTKRYDEAERQAAWLEANHPPHAGAGQLGVAQQLMALNDYERALPYLTRAHDADPNEPHADYALGQALLNLGRAPEAVPHLRHGFEGGIEIPNGGEDYARALVDTEDLPGAATALRRIRLADTAGADAWLRLGRLAMEAKTPDVAVPFFARAAAMQPGDAATRQQYGLALLVLNHFADAARELGEAARLNPRDPDTLSRLAYCELKLGQLAEARRHVLAALAIDPKDPLASQLIGILR
jgi:Flp pilus assembly protein TadD